MCKARLARFAVPVTLLAALILGLVLLFQGPRHSGSFMAADILEEFEFNEDDPDMTRKPGKDDSKHTMPREEAEKLDAAAVADFPYMLPMVPIMYPEAHDEAIVSKLHDLDRDATIHLADGTEFPYWQTLQYANRHFAIYITRFIEGKVGKKVFDKIPEADRVRMWGTSSIFRKLLCHPKFLEWTKGTYKGQHFPDNVYQTFDDVHEGQFTRIWDIANPRVTAVANGRGITWDNKKSLGEKPWVSFLAIYAHESSHNLGYGHETKVPYGIMDFIREAAEQELWTYKTYDLSKTPDFTVA